MLRWDNTNNCTQGIIQKQNFRNIIGKFCTCYVNIWYVGALRDVLVQIELAIKIIGRFNTNVSCFFLFTRNCRTHYTIKHLQIARQAKWRIGKIQGKAQIDSYFVS